MSTEIKNLGLVKAIHVGVNPPINNKILWYNNTPNINKHFYYDTKLLQWVPLANSTVIDSALVKISSQSDNIIKNLSDGLYAKETITELVDFTLVNRELSIKYKNETGVTVEKTVNIETALNDVKIKKFTLSGNILTIEQTDSSTFSVELNSIVNITTINSSTIELSGAGNDTTPLKGEVIISPDSGNLLSKKNNGLFADINFESLNISGDKIKTLTIIINGKSKQVNFTDTFLERLEFNKETGDLNAFVDTTTPKTVNLDGRYVTQTDYEQKNTELNGQINNKVDKRDGYGLISDDTLNEVETLLNEKIVSISVTGEAEKTLSIVKADGNKFEATWRDLFDSSNAPIADIRLNSLSFNVDTGVLIGRRSDNVDLSVNLDGRYLSLSALNEKAAELNRTIIQKTDAIRSEITKLIEGYNIDKIQEDLNTTINNEIVRVYITGDETKTIHLVKKDKTEITHEYTDLARGEASNGVKELSFDSVNNTLKIKLNDESELTTVINIPQQISTLNIGGHTVSLSTDSIAFAGDLVTSNVTKLQNTVTVTHNLDVKKLIKNNLGDIFDTEGGYSLKTLNVEHQNGKLKEVVGSENLPLNKTIIDAINNCFANITLGSNSKQLKFGDTLSFNRNQFSLNDNTISILDSLFSGFIGDAPNDGKQYSRENGAWAAINNPFSFRGSTALNNTNLNTVIQPGVYYQSSASNATLANNYPTDNIRGGTLRVIPVSETGNTIVHQIYTSGGTDGDGSNALFYRENARIFIRKYVAGAWSSWYEMTNSDRVLIQASNNFSTDDTIEEFPQDGATVILPESNVTVQIRGGKRKVIKYIQSSNHTLSFSANVGVTVVGSTSYNAKRGRVIKVVIVDNNAYISEISAQDITTPPPATNEIEDAPDNRQYLRSKGAWQLFSGWEFKELGTENLNDLKVPGFYGKYNSSEATTARNYPYDNIRGGHLLVLPMTLSDNLTIFQVYFSAGTQNSGGYTNSARIFMRAFVNNSEWLPWREFDGGKIHNVTENSLNLANVYKGFPVDNSVFVLNQATTINVPNSVIRCRFIKNTSNNITFSKASGVTIIGKELIDLPEGTEISLVCNGSKAYVNTGSGESVSVNHNIGSWD